MDAVARVESRILDVQARFARFVGQPSTAPVDATGSGGVGGGRASNASSSAGASFRDIAETMLRSQGSPGGSLSTDTLGIRTKAPGMYGRITLPRTLSGARNGQLPDDLLETFGQGEHRLEHTAAVAFRRMAGAAAQDGLSLRVSDSYRSLADQESTAANVGLYGEGGRAATPGTSTHGWGLSVDVDLDDKTQRWLRANASRFGFAEDVAREPWHYTYRPADI